MSDDYFCKGRRVIDDRYPAMIWRGTVTERDGHKVCVTYGTSGVPYCYHLDQAQIQFKPLCFNCRRTQDDHTDAGKCLYGPGSWE